MSEIIWISSINMKDEIFNCVHDEVLKHVARRVCGLCIPGGVQDQAGWSFEHPGLVEGSLPLAGQLDLDDL